MSSRFADPTTMRTRSPIYHDESPKRPPPSPSSKPPPPKKPEPCKAQAVVAPSPEPHVESCTDKVGRPVLQILGSRPLPGSAKRPPHIMLTTTFGFPKSSGNRVVVDLEVFKQILDLDEGDDDREFSQGMVEEYLEQAQATIDIMDESFAKHELTQLSKRSHFLKGSSATLGVVQVQEICEKIQHLGNRLDPDKEPQVKISAEDALARINPLLARLKDEHAAAEKFFEEYQP